MCILGIISFYGWCSITLVWLGQYRAIKPLDLTSHKKMVY